MANREYKSDVFSMLLEDRARALDVYNAMAGTAYTDPEIIEVHTLESGVSLTVHNDASFVVSMDSVTCRFGYLSILCGFSRSWANTNIYYVTSW